jgi:hypothetical protein
MAGTPKAKSIPPMIHATRAATLIPGRTGRTCADDAPPCGSGFGEPASGGGTSGGGEEAWFGFGPPAASAGTGGGTERRSGGASGRPRAVLDCRAVARKSTPAFVSGRTRAVMSAQPIPRLSFKPDWDGEAAGDE